MAGLEPARVGLVIAAATPAGNHANSCEYGWAGSYYSFKDTPDVPQLLEDCRKQNLEFDLMRTSLFLNRETIVLAPSSGLARWRGHLFIWMSHLAAKASDYYRIPSNRVIELGTQVQI